MRYLRLIKAFARYRLIRELEFPGNFIIAVSIHLAFIAGNLIFFTLIWRQVGGFGGLTPYQMLFFLGTFHLADAINMIFTFFGVMEIPEVVRRGDMDYLLTKPVNSQFLTTFRSFSWFAIIDLITGGCLIYYAMTKIGFTLTWHNSFIYAIMVLNGAAISYAMSCMVMTLAFSMVAVGSIWTIFSELGEFQRQPMGIYPPTWRMLFSVFLPMVIVANFPAYFGLGRLTLYQSLWFFAAGALLLFLSHFFWRIGLKKYQSASS